MMVNKKRVLILSYFFAPDISACSFRSHALIIALAEQYPNVTFEVVTTTPSRYSSFKPAINNMSHFDNVTITRIAIPSHSGRFIGELFAASSFFRQVIKKVKREKYDLIYATSAKLLTASVASYLSRKKDAPLVLDIRDLFAENVKDFFSAKVKFFLLPVLTFLNYYTFKQATHINLVSSGFKPFFSKKYISASRSFYTNGIDDVFLADNPRFPSSNFKTPLTVLYAGNIGRAQTLENVIPKIALLLGETVKFKVIGDGRRMAKLIAKLETLKVTNVEVIPPVARDELPYYYQRADVLFLNLDSSESLSYVIPSKLFEYAASGKPMLCGATGFTQQFIETEIDNAQVFIPNDPNSAVEKLKLLRLEKCSRQSFIDQFSRKVIMQQMAKTVMSKIEM
ncbi:glycosyltransferase WbuB [Psychromonas sp. psych-6C06]|uniref:glycosyltransferase family 4 protein n=1 Tax=Psychromonas sp. psych-6C06 TaxID=2058089 RepID=UPI000C33DAC5|nr:glycosyltransferase family 4 protein [Psychromonas sp. psych-6C06]PKF62531.1 glycosyltransferase WbuB [Psychromonas sp. psych-6C06]